MRKLETILQVAFLVAILAFKDSAAKFKRCFNCRSRTELGDCRDPFYVTGNSSTLEHKSHGVEIAPCASGK